MIDLHTHLLPGLDDGSRSLSESIETIKMHSSQGCKTVVCTPHISPAYPNSESAIKQKYDELQEAMAASSVDITLRYGAEYHMETLCEKILHDEPVVFLNNPDEEHRYLLVEFPFAVRPLWLEKLIVRLAGNNIGIVVAHPERYGTSEGFIDIANRCECLFALNGSSVLGEEGTRVKQNAFSFVSKYMSRIVWSSDAHPALNRYPQFDRVIPYFHQKFPQVIIEYWFNMLPQTILRGEKITEYDETIINLYVDNFSKL